MQVNPNNVPPVATAAAAIGMVSVATTTPTTAAAAAAASASSPPAMNVSVLVPPGVSSRTAVKRVEREWQFDRPPRNFDKITNVTDQDAVHFIFEQLLKLHSNCVGGGGGEHCTTEDLPCDFEVVIVPSSRDPARVLYYNCRAWGHRREISLEDMVKLRNCHARVRSVSYDPEARGADVQLTGAIVVGLDSFDYERSVPLAAATASTQTTSTLGATAVPPPQTYEDSDYYHQRNGKRARKSGTWFSWLADAWTGAQPPPDSSSSSSK